MGSRDLRVDGFESSTATAFQFMGCYFHACMDCYQRKYPSDPAHTLHPSFDPETWSDVARRTADNVQYLRDLELQPVVIYECQWRAQLRDLDRQHVAGRRSQGPQNVTRQGAAAPCFALTAPLRAPPIATSPLPLPSPPPPPSRGSGEESEGGGGGGRGEGGSSF